MRESSARPSLILVVEDEPLVQLTALAIIEDAGYRTLAANDAVQALAILETEPAINILFSDVRMPGQMDGRELAWTASARWPDLRIILTSGHETAGPAGLPPGAAFLPKPYRPSALEALLADQEAGRS